MDGLIRRTIFRGVLLLVVAVTTIAIMILLLQAADKAGWIPHRRVAMVWTARNWPESESRHCRLLGDIQTPALWCEGDSERQTMNVEFRGSLHAVEWNCRRKGSALVCTAR